MAEIVGHGALVARLERAAAGGVLSHALLLTGPDSVGKTAAAEALAARVLDAERWPGGLAAHPDHWLEDTDSERIGIDRVRPGGRTDAGPSLQDFLSMRAYAGGRRVAVIARADRLTEQAANCLLKTVEEPPDGAHLILCAAAPDRLPATIVSRCQAAALAPVESGVISEWLERAHGVAPDLARTASVLAAGRPGRALALATEPGALRAETAALDSFVAVAGTGRSGALRAAGELAPGGGVEGRERALMQLSAWTALLRDVACLAAGAPELAVWSAYRGTLERWAEALPPERVTAMLRACLTAAEDLTQYANPRLCFEVLFLDVFTVSPAPPSVADTAPREPVPEGPPPAAPVRRASPGARRSEPGARRSERSGARR